MAPRQLLDDAVQAALLAVKHLDAPSIQPKVLHHSEHISIHLPPLDVVARVVQGKGADVDARLLRELAVTRYLSDQGAPVVAPLAKFPAGPYRFGEFAVTLWQFVEHATCDFDNEVHAANAAKALRRVHDALAEFRGELPSFWMKIERCRRLLENDSALLALRSDDRAFLLAAYHRIVAAVNALPLQLVPIHGDAHVENVFIVDNTARWNDFEDVCLGPREWDIGWVRSSDLKLFEPVNRELLAALSDLRSLCVSVWCWDKYELPEKCAAAEYHLGYLRQRCAITKP